MIHYLDKETVHITNIEIVEMSCYLIIYTADIISNNNSLTFLTGLDNKE